VKVAAILLKFACQKNYVSVVDLLRRCSPSNTVTAHGLMGLI
jgi:hypothetical protein